MIRIKKAKKTAQLNESENTALLAELRQTIGSIDAAMNHFEQVVDPTLIDCYIYELKAAQLRYQFLLRNIKGQQYGRTE